MLFQPPQRTLNFIIFWLETQLLPCQVFLFLAPVISANTPYLLLRESYRYFKVTVCNTGPAHLHRKISLHPRKFCSSPHGWGPLPSLTFWPAALLLNSFSQRGSLPIKILTCSNFKPCLYSRDC